MGPDKTPFLTTENHKQSENFPSSLCLLLSRSCRLTVCGVSWTYIVKLHRLYPPFVPVTIGILAHHFGTFTNFYGYLEGLARHNIDLMHVDMNGIDICIYIHNYIYMYKCE
jgi:hypothetical protein